MIFLVQVRLILKRMLSVLEIVNIENKLFSKKFKKKLGLRKSNQICWFKLKYLVFYPVNFKFSFFVVESDDFRFKSDPYI